MTNYDKLVDMAQSQVGIKEIPSNSNNVKYNTAYYGRAVSGSNYAWCCSFVWWLFKQVGLSSLFYNGEKTAYCPTVRSWAIQKCTWVTKGKKGYLVLFDWNNDGIADHIGVVLGVNADGSYKTIEGNTSIGNDSNGGEVMIRTRKAGIMGFVAWDTSSNVTTKPAESKPVTVDKKVQLIKNLQKAIHVSVDGIVGNQTLGALPLLKKGSMGNTVEIMQELLGKIHKVSVKGGYDGVFGEGTKTAVKTFQAKKGLVADGIVGSKTWRALLK